GVAPYRQVLTHGFAVDQHGRKMSKSLGNVVAPQKVMDAMGADVLRLWIAAADYRHEMSVSDEILKRSADAYRRIRNTARFLLGNLNGFDPSAHLRPLDDMVALDRWIVHRAHLLQEKITDAYVRYDFPEIVQALSNFCSVELGSLYLDVTKDRLYTMGEDSRGRRSAQSAMYRIAEAFVRWIAPILAFTADEMWQHMPEATDTGARPDKDRKSTRLNSSHVKISYAVFCLKKKRARHRPAANAQRAIGRNVHNPQTPHRIDRYQHSRA